ncbi:hypothetical protein [Polycladidibacter hongkongensis]|uniref:hypothetical protein n=1 Tax=Polycladidibacter hongkongensis TaxID=1647556 RepID=UPI0008370E4A|nr:hypothetical protein [Pseudovibrio hongkongensis]
MSDIKTGPLLVTYEDGTKVYQHAIVKDKVIVGANVFAYSFSSELNFNSGNWTKPGLSYLSEMSAKGKRGSIEFSPHKNGLEVSGSVNFRGVEVGLVYDKNGDFVPVLGIGVGVPFFEGLGASAKITLNGAGGSNLSSNDRVAISPDGTTRVTRYSKTDDPSKGYVRVDITVIKPGNVVKKYVSYVVSAEEAARLASGLRQECFLGGTQISMWEGGSKPIEDIRAGDVVTSYDKNGALVPGWVTRRMANYVRHIFNFHA